MLFDLILNNIRPVIVNVGYYNGHLNKAVGMTVDVRGTEHYTANYIIVETAVKE